jgi:hypothetical protein
MEDASSRSEHSNHARAVFETVTRCDFTCKHSATSCLGEMIAHHGMSDRTGTTIQSLRSICRSVLHSDSHGDNRDPFQGSGC